MSSTSTNLIKEERQDEAEIRELAAKLLEANKNKVAATMARQQPTQQQMNLVGYMAKKGDRRLIQSASPSSSSFSSGDDKKATDEESVRGRFGWVQLGKCHIPYIFRTGEKYCAVRMVEMKLFNKYLKYLHQDIYSCTCIRSYYITEAESRLLNEINIKHCDNQFGRDVFTTRDLIVRLSDANEFYNFLDVCYSKLIQGSCNPKDRCGFIRINKESVVPYTVKNDNKYVPLFYFEGETENLKMKADQLEGWDLSYLKFCCKVQGIRNELFAHDSCAVISLNAIKSYFPPGTGFEDYWPSKVVDSQLLLNGKNSTQVGQWTLQPPTPPVAPKGQPKIVQTQPSQAQAVQQQQQQQQQQQTSVPALYGTYAGLAGGQPTFQAIPSGQVARVAQNATRSGYQVPTPTSPASPRPAQRHPYYPPPPLTQAPPPLVRSAVPPTTGAASTYTSPALTPATQSVMMVQDLNGIGQQVNSYPSVTRTNVTLQQRYPPPLIPVRNVNGAQRYHGYPNTTGTDAVDLSSGHLPRNMELGPIPLELIISTDNLGLVTAVTQFLPEHLQPVAMEKRVMMSQIVKNRDLENSSQIRNSEEPNHINMVNGRQTVELGKKLTPIADTPTSGTHVPYKMQKVLVEGKMIPCINVKPYVWTELLVTLPDLVTHFFNSVQLSSCRRVMDVLRIELYRGNRQQMQILMDSGKCQSLNDNLPLVQVHDVIKYMPQMKYMMSGLLSEPVSKRQRPS